MAAFETSHFGLMLNLVQNGQLGLINFPTLVTNNFGFNLHIDLAQLATFDTNPINIPANAFSFEGLRATLEYAYPYVTAQTAMNVVDGIDEGNPFGGFLPSSESAFYAANVPWPNYNTNTHTFANPITAPSNDRRDGSLVLGSGKQLSFGTALRPRAGKLLLVEPAGHPNVRVHHRSEHQRGGARVG